jgi:hypothetical protein
VGSHTSKARLSRPASDFSNIIDAMLNANNGYFFLWLYDRMRAKPGGNHGSSPNQSNKAKANMRTYEMKDNQHSKLKLVSRFSASKVLMAM